MAYGVVHTTNISGRCFDFQATSAVENGSLVTDGGLVTGERNIYVAGTPATATLADKNVYLVANPAWSYDESKTTNQNEENYINKADTPFRVYELKEHDKFTLTNYSITGADLAVGQYVGLTDGSMKPVASATAPTDSAFVGIIRYIDNLGFAYAVGSGGTSTTIGTENMGYAVDNRASMVTIEVVKNG